MEDFFRNPSRVALIAAAEIILAVPCFAQEQAAPPQADAAQQEAILQLGYAASSGDLKALEELNRLSVAAHQDFATNKNDKVFRALDPAFKVIGEEAGKGSTQALDTLLRATTMAPLQGYAVHALGVAAGMGNQKAMEPLLKPDRYGILLSGAVGALKPAADTGNQEAIKFLANVTRDKKNAALWFMVASALRKPASEGNEKAIDGLVRLLASTDNKSVQRESILGLRAAALDGNPKAAEALKKLDQESEEQKP